MHRTAAWRMSFYDWRNGPSPTAPRASSTIKTSTHTLPPNPSVINQPPLLHPVRLNQSGAGEKKSRSAVLFSLWIILLQSHICCRKQRLKKLSFSPPSSSLLSPSLHLPFLSFPHFSVHDSPCLNLSVCSPSLPLLLPVSPSSLMESLYLCHTLRACSTPPHCLPPPLCS